MVLFPFITKDGATRVPPRRWNPGRAGYSQGAAHGKGPEMKGTRRPQRVGRGLPAPGPLLLLRGVSSESPAIAGGRGRHEREPGFLSTAFGTAEKLPARPSTSSAPWSPRPRQYPRTGRALDLASPGGRPLLRVPS